MVLYASSQVDKRKVGKLALAIQVAFQELGVFPTSNTKIPLDLHNPMPFSTVQAIENAKYTTELSQIASTPNGEPDSVAEEANIATLKNELQQALQHEIDIKEVSLHRETEGLVISLQGVRFLR